MKILCIGDVVGSPGRRIFASVVPRLRAEGVAHAVVVNGENGQPCLCSVTLCLKLREGVPV